MFQTHHKAATSLTTPKTEAEARDYAEFMANTYGGVAKIYDFDKDAHTAKYSAKKGWH